jgi:transposase-like protein
MTEREASRNAARRLSIIRHAEEVTGTVAQTCRYFGISRQTFYAWLRRYQEQGLPRLSIGSPPIPSRVHPDRQRLRVSAQFPLSR